MGCPVEDYVPSLLMPPDDPQSFIIESNSLGVVGNFDSTILARIPNKDSLHMGQLFLRATLDEMIKIRQFSKDLDEDNNVLLQDTGDKYFDLQLQTKDLQSLEQQYKHSSWMVKLFKPKRLKRARRAFVSNTFELWNSTSTKSGTMGVKYFMTPTADLAAVESDSVPKNQPISGVVLDVPKGPLTQEAITLAQEIMGTLAVGNPFADPSTSGGQVGQSSTTSAVAEAGASSLAQSSSPSGRTSIFGPTSFNFNIFNNTNSTTSGIVIKNAHGDGGSGTFCPARELAAAAAAAVHVNPTKEHTLALSGDHPSVSNPPS